jgi:hypothetical protein
MLKRHKKMRSFCFFKDFRHSKIKKSEKVLKMSKKQRKNGKKTIKNAVFTRQNKAFMI